MAASEDFDIESIAAFIDGRVTGIARDRVVKTLTESDAAFEIYAEALQTRADLIDGTVIPIAATRRRGPWLVAVPAAAAAILLVAVMPRMQARHQRASLAAPVATIARPVLAVQAGLPIQVGEHNWKVSRGSGTVLVESTSVFRLGVRAADLHISLATGERDAAGRVTGEMVDLLQPIRISDAVRADYVDVRARIDGGYPTREILAVSDSAERRLAEFLGSTWFDVGKWFGAGEYSRRCLFCVAYDRPIPRLGQRAWASRARRCRSAAPSGHTARQGDFGVGLRGHPRGVRRTDTAPRGMSWRGLLRRRSDTAL